MDTAPADRLNPFAGSHPVTADPLEVEAARAATDAALREFPYFLHRYGERARLFGTSDGGWLATLPDEAPERVRQQVLWLGSVLAARGMPRLLLERHLELLHRELRARRPGRAERYAALLDAAALLRRRREARLTAETVGEVEARFAARASPYWTERLPGMGRILAAAVADEADGLTQAVPSLLEWVLDPARFPTDWLRAAEAAVAEARAGVIRPDDG